LPPDRHAGAAADVGTRIAQTLGAPGPWLVALAFGAYSAQWLAVIGFLPSIYRDAGLAPGWTALATAGAAAINIVGNLASGRLLQRGVRAPRLLALGFFSMGVGGVLAFSPLAGEGAAGALLRYAGVLALSGIGGVIPGTLFSLAVRLAPGERTVSTTVGWMQQWSAIGQFAGPPLVAWVASRAGGWESSWLVTGGCALAGLALAAVASRLPPLRGH
jgi:MFS family permease